MEERTLPSSHLHLPSFSLSCPLKLPCWFLCPPPPAPPHTHTLLTPSPHPTVAKLSPGTSSQASGRGAFLRCSTLTLAGHNRGTTTGACGSSVVQRQLRDRDGGYYGTIIHRCSTVGLLDFFSQTKTRLFMCNLVLYPPCADKPLFHPPTTASTCHPRALQTSPTATYPETGLNSLQLQENLSPLV